MGKESDKLAVVDSKCHVFGTQNLRVVDSSIMPSVASGNLNAPTIALAEKESFFIIISEQEIFKFLVPEINIPRFEKSLYRG